MSSPSRDESVELSKNKNTAYAIDERRRAALASIDNAKFSYVFLVYQVVLLTNRSLGGFMSKLSLLLV